MNPVKVDEKTKTVKVNLNGYFYPRPFISQAKKDFSKVCRTEIKREKHLFELTLKPLDKKQDLNELGYGFCNYVLGLIQNRE